MSALIRAIYFKVGYRLGKMPWDTGKPQPSLVAIEQQGHVAGAVLDIGCGAGDNAIHLAARGYRVHGIDLSAAAIARAKRAAQQRGVTADFRVADIFALPEGEPAFDTAIDYGLFHQFRGAEIARYVGCLRRLMPQRQTLVLQCFSDAADFSWPYPRCVSKGELQEAFDAGWRIEHIEAVRYETRTVGEVPAWLAIIRREP
jgi:cyclopropane fatty-acyl-phospholipid synthase-like methyltransferase